LPNLPPLARIEPSRFRRRLLLRVRDTTGVLCVEGAWPPPLFPTISGRRSLLFCLPIGRSHEVAGRLCPTGWHWRASFLCCGQASSGAKCLWRWVAAARPAGVGWWHGSAQECGQPCIVPCSSACVMQTGWTGAAPHWTARQFAQKEGRADRPQPNRPRQIGHQAPHRRRWARHTAWPDAEQGQPQRQPYDGRHPRCRPAGEGTPWAATPPTAQAACRQGLRSSPVPSRLSRAWNHPTHCAARHRQQREARPSSMESGANLGLAGPVPKARHPLRPQSRRPPWIGISGQLPSESLAALRRNPHSYPALNGQACGLCRVIGARRALIHRNPLLCP